MIMRMPDFGNVINIQNSQRHHNCSKYLINLNLLWETTRQKWCFFFLLFENNIFYTFLCVCYYYVCHMNINEIIPNIFSHTTMKRYFQQVANNITYIFIYFISFYLFIFFVDILMTTEFIKLWWRIIMWLEKNQWLMLMFTNSVMCCIIK